MKRSAALLGGDRRQVYLARLLLEDSWKVVTWGLEKGDAPNGVPLHSALESEIIILPLPVCREGKLHLPLTDTTLEEEKLWPRLRYDQLLLGGMTGELSRRLMLDHGLTLVDYYQREEVQIANAVPTAEGAIQRAIEATERTLHTCRCLVIGYGRIGKILAQRLKALGSEVTVSARKYSDLAWIKAFGYQTLPTKALTGVLDHFHLIFNTVPSPVLSGALLREVRPDGKPSVTRVEVLHRDGRLCKLSLEPVTGRTHQLRLHCAYMGWPILGDPQYASTESLALSQKLGFPHQLLCAHKLELNHPITGDALTIVSTMDVYFPDKW